MVPVVIATIPQQARVAIIIMVFAMLKMEASRGRKRPASCSLDEQDIPSSKRSCRLVLESNKSLPSTLGQEHSTLMVANMATFKLVDSPLPPWVTSIYCILC